MLTAAANPAAAHTSQKIASCLNAAAVSKLGKCTRTRQAKRADAGRLAVPWRQVKIKVQTHIMRPHLIRFYNLCNHKMSG